ncbi:MAG: Rv2578c family radical SAM protein [Tomitella sp.]|nr:Rv2578c family radical SAM protein [Tomitella sp.]
MRWIEQSLDADDGALPGLGRAGLVRTVATPEFEGVTFHEVLCKSALSKVPDGSNMPFRWTINPMRGCLHQCRYCFARPTHEYLDLDAGKDFDTQIVVKMNIAAVLRKELSRRSWHGEPVALGTNTDPYQRAEGRYGLMPGIIRALAGSGTPFSILTKGTLLRRDLPLLSAASERVDVSLSMSLAMMDPAMQKAIEPGTPSPAARLELIRAIRRAGFEPHIMVAPVIPYLTDGRRELAELFGALADAGARTVTVIPMNLRGSTRGWFMDWLAREHPKLVGRYRRLYGRGANVPGEYRAWLRERVTPLLDEHGLSSGSPVDDDAASDIAGPDSPGAGGRPTDGQAQEPALKLF